MSDATRSQQRRNLARRVIGSAELQQVRLLRGSCMTRIASPDELELELRMQAEGRVTGLEIDEFTVEAEIDVVAVRPATDDDPYMKVSGVFELHYAFPEELELSREEISAFAEINGVFNAWSYFREYVQSTTVRMGLPPVTLPLQRMSKRKGAAKRPQNQSEARKTAAQP